DRPVGSYGSLRYGLGVSVNTGFGERGLLSIFLREARSAKVAVVGCHTSWGHVDEKVDSLLGSQRP
ncbi:MAG: hypothetical protein MK165_17405, partial [Pirellulaceae bacterium]|nr:hypothetical protein [Pirellulaceae bacterium]